MKQKWIIETNEEAAVLVLELIGPGHVVDVHPDLVGNIGRQLWWGCVGKLENHTSPELSVLQQLQRSIDQLILRLHPLQFVQIEALRKRERS